MPEESPTHEATHTEEPAFELREHKDGIVEIYANFIDICWGCHDVRLRLGRSIPIDGGYSSSKPLRIVVEQTTAVTMAWCEAKLLRDMLTDAVERYELANGELKWPNLATQNVRESRQAQLLASAPQGKAN
jgi:hypothetical protein